MLVLATGLLALATTLGWFGGLHPWLEMLTNAPTQMMVTGLLLLIAATVSRRWFVACLSLFVVVWFGAQLWPYWRAAPDPLPADAASVLIAQQYNVYFGNSDLDRIAAEVRASNADVVALHEITSEQWRGLRDRLTEYPHAIAEPWDGGELQLGGGMALISRTPLTSIAVDGEASVTGRPILAASTDLGGHEIVVVGLHPHASRFEKHKVDLREAQLGAVVGLLADEARPAIVLTDLNMTPTSSDYRAFLDDLDWRDPHKLTGWDASWPARGGAFGLPIDHIFVSDAVALHDIKSTGGGGSDHRALTAQFSVSG